MFDIGWPEMLIVGMIALFVVGPKELPRVLMTMSRYWRKIRGMAMDFRGQFDDLIREAELDEIRKEVSQASKLDIPSTIDLDPTGGGPGPATKKMDTSPKPASTPASETKPAETKPADTKPAETEATETKKPESGA